MSLNGTGTPSPMPYFDCSVLASARQVWPPTPEAFSTGVHDGFNPPLRKKFRIGFATHGPAGPLPHRGPPARPTSVGLAAAPASPAASAALYFAKKAAG